MPPPEVVRSVPCVQKPVEINRYDAPDDVTHQELLQLASGRSIPVVEGDATAAAGLLLNVQYPLALQLIRSHWLLGDDVRPQLHRPTNVFVVMAVLRRDNHNVDVVFGHHLIKLRMGIRKNINTF